MRIIIAGSRTVNERDVRKALQSCPWIGFTSAVISGTAKGADRYGEKWAEEHQIRIYRFPAEWKKYGKSAGPMRNKVMADNAEGLIAIWDGQSRGTKNMIDLAIKKGLRIFIYRFDDGTTKEIPPSGDIAYLWENAEERAAIKEYGSGIPRIKAEYEAGKDTTILMAGSKNR